MLKFFSSPYSLMFFSAPLIFYSCNTFDPPVVVPAYGHIDSIHFSVPPDSALKQGSASAKIPYAWVYLDDNPVGAFQMPCTFPIIASNGNHNIKIFSGIIPAGGNSPASINPFYQYYSINVNLQQGVTSKFQPTSIYYSWVQFPIVENFEENSTIPLHIVKSTGTQRSDTNMINTHVKSLVFEGKASGMAIVDSAHSAYVGMTDPPQNLPANGATPVFMELNYRSTAPFEIGLYEGDTNYISPIVVFPSSTWNKMYVVLQSTLQTYFSEPDRIYFYIQLDTQDGHTKDTLLLDNVKLLY